MMTKKEEALYKNLQNIKDDTLADDFLVNTVDATMNKSIIKGDNAYHENFIEYLVKHDDFKGNL